MTNDEEGLNQVIIVDDGISYRLMMKKIIETYFYAEIHLAEDPSEAFELLKKVKPTLIVLDMQMPVMDGFTALKQFRARADTKETPVIAFTALADTNLIAELFKWKISDYIKKPSTTEIIVRKLKPFLQLKRDI